MCGLAHDLGVPDAKVVTIVHAEVAALCRGALIDAEAAFRAIKRGEQEKQGDLLLALVRIAGALQAFPLPPGSAEAEMVAAGVVKQTTLEFRKASVARGGACATVSPALHVRLDRFVGCAPGGGAELAVELACASAPPPPPPPCVWSW